MDRLLPCPFCGSEDVIYHDECDEEAGRVTSIAVCRVCRARGGIKSIRQGGVGAEEMWNRRIYDHARVVEWTKADAEGRLVVMPRDGEEQWCLKASDNTDCVLAYVGGIYCVTDAYGRVICEFMNEAALAAGGGRDD